MRKEYDFSHAKRGAVAPAEEKGKTRITIRIDDDILDWFRQKAHAGEGGGSYQSLINGALRSVIDEAPLEKVVRRVVREELRRAQPRTKRSRAKHAA